MKITKAENKTQEKFQALLQQVKILQQKEEMRSKRKKKNNIIINSKGTNYTTDKTNMETRVKEIIDKLATGISPVSMTLIGQDNLKRALVRVTFKNFEDKLSVVQNKATLRGQDIFIVDDLTKDERSIQAALRQRDRTEREKGNDEVRVRYKKYY